ncbi:Nitrate/nitrite transporter [Snodgrassella alvi SCGC AB-598-O11]|nr:Nitrate/nitrite transporter [Snodgrassella alvi SCGC AB-598-O11]
MTAVNKQNEASSHVPPLIPTQNGTLELHDITIVDQNKLKKAISAAALGNAMEWFDFGVYGFVAYALGQVFFPSASPSVQIIAALGTFSVPFLVRPLGGVFFGILGDRFGRQKVLSTTITAC